MQDPCWRVAIRVYRRDALGTVHVVEREGPIIQAPDAAEARSRAEAIFAGTLDFASVGEASYRHRGHQNVAVASSRERRPSTAPDVSLEASLLRMATVIRARSHR